MRTRDNEVDRTISHNHTRPLVRFVIQFSRAKTVVVVGDSAE
jgi:hypothetical protein